MNDTLGKRIAAHRKRLGLTQEQLAEKLGITAQAVSKWENDQSCPDISVLPTLADIFGTSTDILLGRIHLPSITEQAEDFGENTAEESEDPPPDEYAQENNKGVHINVNLGDGENVSKRYLIGTAAYILAVGVLYLLAKLLGWECSLWDIMWPTFLLAFGVCGLIGHISLFWLSCVGVGAFFLINYIIPSPLELDNGILWAVIIIFCGAMLLVDALTKKYKKKHYFQGTQASGEYRVTDGLLSCSNSFGELNQTVITEVLKGGKISNSFGEYIVDLSGVDAVGGDCKLELSCSFGEMVLLIPRRFAADAKISKSFADYSVEGQPDANPEGLIILRGSVSFGDLTIRYI